MRIIIKKTLTTLFSFQLLMGAGMFISVDSFAETTPPPTTTDGGGGTGGGSDPCAQIKPDVQAVQSAPKNNNNTQCHALGQSRNACAEKYTATMTAGLKSRSGARLDQAASGNQSVKTQKEVAAGANANAAASNAGGAPGLAASSQDGQACIQSATQADGMLSWIKSADTQGLNPHCGAQMSQEFATVGGETPKSLQRKCKSIMTENAGLMDAIKKNSGTLMTIGALGVGAALLAPMFTDDEDGAAASTTPDEIPEIADADDGGLGVGGECPAGTTAGEGGLCTVADERCEDTPGMYATNDGCQSVPLCESGSYFDIELRSCKEKSCSVGLELQASGSCVDPSDTDPILAGEQEVIEDPIVDLNGNGIPDNEEEDPFAALAEGEEGLASTLDSGAGGLSSGSAGGSGGGASSGPGGRNFAGFAAGAGGGSSGRSFGGGRGGSGEEEAAGSKVRLQQVRWNNVKRKKTLQQSLQSK